LTAIRDDLTLGVCEKGKPVERRGRKATGLKERVPTTAGLPHRALARALALPSPSRESAQVLADPWR